MPSGALAALTRSSSGVRLEEGGRWRESQKGEGLKNKREAAVERRSSPTLVSSTAGPLCCMLGGINSSRGLFRIDIMLVLLWRAQACGLEGNDKPDEDLSRLCEAGMLIFHSLSLFARFAGHISGEPTERAFVVVESDPDTTYLSFIFAFWSFLHYRYSRARFELLLLA